MAARSTPRFLPQLRRRIRRERFLFLLIALLAFLLLAPLLEGFVGLRLLMSLSYTVVLITSVYALSQSRRQLVAAVLLALPMLVSTWLNQFFNLTQTVKWGAAAGSVFIGYTLVMILGFIARCRRISRDLLFAAIVVYLLMGLMWGFFYELLESLSPGSFQFPAGPIGEGGHRYAYFSYVTLTTLGYGDMTPASDVAASLAILEAIIGQMYLVVGVAWLVGLHISQRMAGGEDETPGT